MGGWTDEQVMEALALLDELCGLLEALGPWIVCGALCAGIIAGLQAWWLVLRGKDARRIW